MTALGYWEKRNCPGGRFECLGSAMFLRIEEGKPVYLFIPFDRRLVPVEAILEEQ
jgi:hypothetical protein